jgi:hypothetical protein
VDGVVKQKNTKRPETEDVTGVLWEGFEKKTSWHLKGAESRVNFGLSCGKVLEKVSVGLSNGPKLGKEGRNGIPFSICSTMSEAPNQQNVACEYMLSQPGS